MTNNNNCFGYIRVSTVKQGEGVSLEAQKEAIEAFANRNDLCIIQWFEEKETAAKRGRPIFTSMIKQLHQGKANNLIVHKIDRSARNLTDWAKIGELSDAGVNVHFATESLDFRSRGGRLTADIQAVIAADYIRNLREETVKGVRGRLKQGLYPLPAPIGYLNNGKGKAKTIDPVRGPLVEMIFKEYASATHSLRSITKFAKEIGLLNLLGNPISKNAIDRMLENPFYTGLIQIKKHKEIYAGVHKPLISNSLFKLVADVKHGRKCVQKSKHDYLFRGLLNCHGCTRAMVGEFQYKYVYYRCHNSSCPNKTVREDKLKKMVYAILRETEFKKDSIVELNKRLDLWLKEKTNVEIHDPIPMQIEQIQLQKDRTTDAVISGLIDQETSKRKLARLCVQEIELVEKQKFNNEKQKNIERIQKALDIFKSLYLTYDLANHSEKRQLLKVISSKRILGSENLYFKPRNWLRMAKVLQSVPTCTQNANKFRRDNELGIDPIEELLEATDCPYFQELLRLHHNIMARNECNELPNPSTRFH